ncbi:MAG: response regulator [Calditrichaeota bacterium]|nr:response regulator [Calditrichota bacterium]
MCRILIVDDDPSIRQMLRSMLEREGHDVDVASNGAECLRLFRATSYELVITDIIMPEQEGIETIRRLRAEKPEIRVIAISGGGRIGPADYLSMAKLIGASATLAKPFERAALLEAVQSALSLT